MFSSASIKFFTMGMVFGVTSGITPGPLLTLVITETLKHNVREGMKIALSPLISDFPIILLSLFIFSKLLQLQLAFAIISLLGGVFIAYLGYQTWKIKEFTTGEITAGRNSLQKGITVNLLNPGPYVFWCTIGTPLILKAYAMGVGTVIGFLAAFYISLIGSKITVVMIISRTKSFMNNTAYVWIMRVLGTALFVFSIFFFKDAFNRFTA
jgi:threonine/homoserine/homoserine lactone efflux protein